MVHGRLLETASGTRKSLRRKPQSHHWKAAVGQGHLVWGLAALLILIVLEREQSPQLNSTAGLEHSGAGGMKPIAIN